MSTSQERLAGSGWQQQIVPIKVQAAKKKIEKDNSAFAAALESAMMSTTFDEDVIGFLTDQFVLPLPLLVSQNEIEQMGYCALTWNTLEYNDVSRGWPEAIVCLKERALHAGVNALGKPSKLEQYLSVSYRRKTARQKWINDIIENPCECFPDGTIVAHWNENDAWFTSKPIYNNDGRVIGYSYALYYRDARFVQTCARNGLVIEIGPGRYKFQELKADFKTHEFGTWSQPEGILDYFSKNLFLKEDKGRVATLVLGPSGGGKTQFVRSMVSELARDYVIFRVAPSEFAHFEYPLFLQKILIIVEDIEDMIPPRGTGRKGSDEILAKLEFNPLLKGENSGKLTHFGLICSCNTLQIDHAAVENPGRFDKIFYLDPSGWKTSTIKRQIVIIDNQGIGEGTISSIVERAANSVSSGLH